MQIKDCFYLGKIVKKHGLKGDVSIKFDTDEPYAYQKLESVFIDINGMLVPFFIVSHKQLPNGNLVATFEDTNLDAAERLVGHNLYLPLDLLPKLTGNKFYYHEVIGFTVVDHLKGEVGKITGVNDQTAQPILVVESNGKDILVPLHDDFLDEVDRENKIFKIKAPNGLLDLYM